MATSASAAGSLQGATAHAWRTRRHREPRRQGACLSILRELRWQGEGADARRAEQSIVDTMDKPCYPTSSAPPCLRGNLPRSRPRERLRQAPRLLAMTAVVGTSLLASVAAAGH